MNTWQKNQIKAINTKHTVPKLNMTTPRLCNFLFPPLYFSSLMWSHPVHLSWNVPAIESFRHLFLSSWCPSHLLDPLAPWKKQSAHTHMHTQATLLISRFLCLATHDQIKQNKSTVTRHTESQLRDFSRGPAITSCPALWLVNWQWCANPN